MGRRSNRDGLERLKQCVLPGVDFFELGLIT